MALIASGDIPADLLASFDQPAELALRNVLIEIEILHSPRRLIQQFGPLNPMQHQLHDVIVVVQGADLTS
jgi:hypothetical protein